LIGRCRISPTSIVYQETAMSQRSVELAIGVLATEEALRLKFTHDPSSVLLELNEKRGIELTYCEQWALSRLNPEALNRFADEIDGRLQRMSLDGGGL